MAHSDFDITEARFKPLRLFTMHGTNIHHQTGDQVIGDCPFCFKDDHFFINWQKILWDCKVCGEHGNKQTFLEKINDRNLATITKAQKESLAEDRSFLPDCLNGIELGFHKGQFTIAIRDEKAKLIDLRIYKIGGKVMSTASCKAGIFGLDKLLKDRGNTVYICEGEWDTVAMQWLLVNANKPGVAVCSPGAGTFKPEWVDFFLKKEVIVCYDHDDAGKKGELTVLDRLKGKIKSIKFIHWPEGSNGGYDLRDFITKKGMLKKVPKRCFRLLNLLIKPNPRTEQSGQTDATLAGVVTPEIDPSVTPEDVFKAFTELYHEPNLMGIEMALITMLAGAYKTEPIWMFLVAPPSSGKTAIINALKYFTFPSDDLAIFTSHITTHSLISGMETKKGDPSLFHQLDGTNKALIIKDFTGVLGMRPQDKEDVYGQFRDGHDGYTSKMFGNGITREYHNLHFHCFAAVTEAIYDESANFQALGERFGKLNIGKGNDLKYSRDVMSKAMTTRDDFKRMEERTASIVYSCVKNLIKKVQDNDLKLPTLSPELQKALIGISLYVAAMRGVVSRDKYKRDYIKSAPSSDMGIRNLKMLGAIAAVRAALYGRTEATLEDLPLIRKIALDTINQRDEELLRNIYLLNKNKDQITNKARILEESRYTAYTVRCVTEDLVMLDILEKKKEGKRFYYTLSERMNTIVTEARLYDSPEELTRVNPKIRPNRSRNGEGKFSIPKIRRKNG